MYRITRARAYPMTRRESLLRLRHYLSLTNRSAVKTESVTLFTSCSPFKTLYIQQAFISCRFSSAVEAYYRNTYPSPSIPIPRANDCPSCISISTRLISTLSSHLRIGLPGGILPLGFHCRIGFVIPLDLRTRAAHAILLIFVIPLSF